MKMTFQPKKKSKRKKEIISVGRIYVAFSSTQKN